MEINEIKEILRSCPKGEVLLHIYVTHRDERIFCLFEFPEMVKVRSRYGPGTGRARGHVKNKERLYVDHSGKLVRLSWTETFGIKHPTIKKHSFEPATIYDGDEIYKGCEKIKSTLEKYEMGGFLVSYALELCQQGFPK